VRLGNKLIDPAGQCIYAGSSGPRLVVTVLPNTELSTLTSDIAAGRPLGPALLEASDVASVILLQRGAAVVEIALEYGTLDEATRDNRIASLASDLVGIALPTVTPAPAGTKPTARPLPTAGPPPGQTVTGQTASQKVKETDSPNAFVAKDVIVKANDVVQWDNTAKEDHNVVFDDFPEITSDTMHAGATYQIRFTRAGKYAYRCTFHAEMVGTVTVS
jgi:plastocyanin